MTTEELTGLLEWAVAVIFMISIQVMLYRLHLARKEQERVTADMLRNLIARPTKETR